MDTNGAPSPSNTATTNTTMSVDTRHDLSLKYKLMRAAIKPLRPRFARPGNPLPSGSPRLSSLPDFPATPKGYWISEEQDPETGLWLYDVMPSERSDAQPTPPHRVLYFSGGGFQATPSKLHWKFVAALASALPTQYQFTLVSYPLAPNSPAIDSLPLLKRYLSHLIDSTCASGAPGRVSLMGDSHGANVALSLALWWAEHGRLETPRLDGATSQERMLGLPSVIALSPAVDLRNSNTRIWEVERLDPVLDFASIETAAVAWSGAIVPPPPPGGSDGGGSRRGSARTGHGGGSGGARQPPSIPRDDPSISPLLSPSATFRAVAATGMQIHGVVGTRDVLAPDALLFRERCDKGGVRGEWLVWEDQMHCFVLAGLYYGLPEGKKGMEFVVDVLRRNV